MRDRDSEIFRQLQAADWPTLARHLLYFTLVRIRLYSWRYGGTFVLPQGYTAEDIVQEVIVRTISGDRRWDPEKGELLPWLKWQVRSIVDALARSAAHRHEELAPDAATLPGDDPLGTLATNYGAFNSVAASPEALFLDQESVDRRVGHLFAAVSGEPDLEAVLNAVLDGAGTRPREIAAFLEVPVSDIYNRLKRIRRRVWKDLS